MHWLAMKLREEDGEVCVCTMRTVGAMFMLYNFPTQMRKLSQLRAPLSEFVLHQIYLK